MMYPPAHKPRSNDDFEIAIICALSLEAGMVDATFDRLWETHKPRQAAADTNVYTTGAIGQHNVVLVHMPDMGGNPAASVSAQIRSTFPQIKVAFVVGICGASPVHPDTGDEIILGDCVLGTTIIQYDLGRRFEDRFIRKEDTLKTAEPGIKALVNKLQIPRNLDSLTERLQHHLATLQNASTAQKDAQYPGAMADRLFNASHLHIHYSTPTTCDNCSPATGSCTKSCELLGCSETVERTRLSAEALQAGFNRPQIHFGRYGSANTVVRSSSVRDNLAREEKITAFEMEGAGVGYNLPVILVKSVCDYADSHKNKKWQAYAAATAAAGLKSVLEFWPNRVAATATAASAISLNVPETLVAHFVDRMEIQQELDSWLHDEIQQHRLVLRGMGGSGKSQLALTCCKKAMLSGHFTTVIWFDASSILSIEQSVSIILEELDEGGTVSLDAKKNMTLLTKALQSRGGSWLAVYDNYDTPAAFSQSPITDYLPKAGHGKVIFTSRHADSERLGRAIQVSGMTEDESVELLLRGRDAAERATGVKIATELGHLALTLDQAAAYIRARDLPLEDFLRHYKHRKKKILEETPQQWEYGMSAFTTWELSFEQLSGTEEVKKNKEHFLTLCAFFDLSSISKDYFANHTTSKQWISILKSGPDWDGFLFDDLVAECRKLSLFQSENQFGNQTTPISLHPLIRDWLKLRRTSEELVDIGQEFTQMLSSYIKASDLDSLELIKRQRLLSNVMSCLEGDLRFQHVAGNYSTDMIHSAKVFAAVFKSNGIYNMAEQLYTQVLANSRELRDKHPDTLEAMHDLAIVYDLKGRYDEAEQLYMQVLANSREQLGDKHSDTLRTMHNLAIVYRLKGRYDEAEQLYMQVLAVEREQLGDKHSDTLRTMHNLAIVYRLKGRYDEAEQLYMQVLAGRQEQLGDKHPKTLLTMHNLAIVYESKGRHDEAEDMLLQVLAGRQEQLGDKHPETLGTMEGLALVYESKGRHDEAEELFLQALAGSREQLGDKHPDTLRIIQNLTLFRKDKASHDQNVVQENT